MSSENVIHIKLSYTEALKAKRSILSLEMGSLNIARNIVRYGAIRMEELGLKSKLYEKVKEAKTDMKDLQSLLPTPKIPKIIKREELKEKYPKEESRSYKEGDIEFQLREIQRRLTELQSQNI